VTSAPAVPLRRQNEPLAVQPHGQVPFGGFGMASCAPWPWTDSETALVDIWQFSTGGALDPPAARQAGLSRPAGVRHELGVTLRQDGPRLSAQHSQQHLDPLSPAHTNVEPGEPDERPACHPYAIADFHARRFR
jgi:hypothetical protein